jgi:ribosomal protein L34E
VGVTSNQRGNPHESAFKIPILYHRHDSPSEAHPAGGGCPRYRSALAAATVLLTGTAILVTTPAHAVPPPPPTCAALLPATAQNRDMALGLDNAPVANRDSSGLSRAERWRIIQLPGGKVVLRNNRRNGADQVVAAAVTSLNGGSPVVTKPVNTSDTRQQWRRLDLGGKVTYTNEFSGKNISFTPSSVSTPFVQFTGVGGDQFIEKPVTCLD